MCFLVFLPDLPTYLHVHYLLPSAPKEEGHLSYRPVPPLECWTLSPPTCPRTLSLQLSTLQTCQLTPITVPIVLVLPWFIQFFKRKETKCRVTIWLSSAILRYVPSEIETYSCPKTYAQIFTEVVLYTPAKRLKQDKCPSTDEWVSEMWSVQTMEYYLAIKRN